MKFSLEILKLNQLDIVTASGGLKDEGEGNEGGTVVFPDPVNINING